MSARLEFFVTRGLPHDELKNTTAMAVVTRWDATASFVKHENLSVLLSPSGAKADFMLASMELRASRVMSPDDIQPCKRISVTEWDDVTGKTGWRAEAGKRPSFICSAPQLHAARTESGTADAACGRPGRA